MEKPTKIYTIIVTYNAMRRNWIERCLLSLETSSVPVIPIVIDNASTDDTVTYIQEHHPQTVLFPQKENLGFGQGNNLGIQYAIKNGAECIILLNQDASLHPLAVEYMINCYDGESLISPVHYNGDGTCLDKMFRDNTLCPSRNDLFDHLLTEKDLKPSYSIGEVAAACWLLPVKIIRTVGGFNPLFFQYGEDNNYYQRLRYHTKKILLCPKAKMYHDRQLHGNIQLYNKYLLHKEVLLIVCDINKSFWGCIPALIMLTIKCYRKRLPQHQYKIGGLTRELIWTIAHTPRILRSRKEEKSINATWLKI